MPGKEVGDQWSLVLTAFTGDFWAFHEAAPTAFGRPGLDTFSLALSREEDGHRPAEIAANLPQLEALRIAEVLERTGAKVEVIPTDQVAGVRHRSQEVWASRCANGFSFSEVEDTISTKGLLNAQAFCRRQMEVHPEQPRWERERGLNHNHVGNISEPPREGQRLARHHWRELATALQTAYPEHAFVVEHWIGQGCSFYHAGDGAPEADTPPDGPIHPKAWCSTCHHQEPYHLRPTPDAEFPMAEWGDCSVCGEEVIVRGGKVRTVVGRRQ